MLIPVETLRLDIVLDLLLSSPLLSLDVSTYSFPSQGRFPPGATPRGCRAEMESAWIFLSTLGREHVGRLRAASVNQRAPREGPGGDGSCLLPSDVVRRLKRRGRCPSCRRVVLLRVLHSNARPRWSQESCSRSLGHLYPLPRASTPSTTPPLQPVHSFSNFRLFRALSAGSWHQRVHSRTTGSWSTNLSPRDELRALSGRSRTSTRPDAVPCFFFTPLPHTLPPSSPLASKKISP